MKYFEAESMQQEMIVALQFKDAFPEQYIEVAKKYSIEQWKECVEALLNKLNKERESIGKLINLIILARKHP